MTIEAITDTRSDLIEIWEIFKERYKDSKRICKIFYAIPKEEIYFWKLRREIDNRLEEILDLRIKLLPLRMEDYK